MIFIFGSWILWLFNFNEEVVHGIYKLFNKEVSEYTYWFIFWGSGFVLQVIDTLYRIFD